MKREGGREGEREGGRREEGKKERGMEEGGEREERGREERGREERGERREGGGQTKEQGHSLIFIKHKSHSIIIYFASS